MATANLYFDPTALQAVESAFAPLEKLTNTNLDTFVRAFDYTTEEYTNGTLLVPTDADTSGTVTFRLYWIPRTAPAIAENVVWTFQHAPVNGAEDYDITYTEEKATASAASTTQDTTTETTWTETVSNLGWAVNDIVFFRVTRDSADANDTLDTRADTNDDALLLGFSIEIPLA